MRVTSPWLDINSTSPRPTKKECLRKLTAIAGGYHGAHVTIAAAPPILSSLLPLAITAAAAVVCLPSALLPVASPHGVVASSNSHQFYYCWTHGLGQIATTPAPPTNNPLRATKSLQLPVM